MIKVAVIGIGGMGSWHIENLKRVKDFQVIGGYDINPAKKEILNNWGYKFYSDENELFADEEIDLVVIATPNNFHKHYVLKTICSGKNVVCEKPAMMNAEDMKECIKAAEERKKLFTVHQNRRWDKDFLIVKKVLESNTIGSFYFIDSRVQGSRGIPGDWRCVKEAGGGMLLDWGVHLLDQMLCLVKSPVKEVYAQLLSVNFKDVDDNLKILLKFENGVCAQIQVDTNCFINYPRWHISAIDGTMVIDDWNCTGKIVKANTLSFNWEEGIIYTETGRTKTMAPRPLKTLDTLPLPEVYGGWEEFYKNIADVLLNNAEPIVKTSEVLKVIEVMDACFLSNEKGIAVNLK